MFFFFHSTHPTQQFIFSSKDIPWIPGTSGLPPGCIFILCFFPLWNYHGQLEVMGQGPKDPCSASPFKKTLQIQCQRQLLHSGKQLGQPCTHSQQNTALVLCTSSKRISSFASSGHRDCETCYFPKSFLPSWQSSNLLHVPKVRSMCPVLLMGIPPLISLLTKEKCLVED